jgi:hypothetical protein
MGKIGTGVLRDWNNGEIMNEADYEQEREILRVAINDNYDRLIKKYEVLDASGLVKTTQNLDTAINFLKFKESSSIVLTLDTLTSTMQLAVVDGSITTAKLANLNVTTAKIADGNVTTIKLADLNVTREKVADGAINLQKLDLVSLDSRYYTEGEIDNKLSSIAGGQAYSFRKGTTFPASPLEGDVFYRTDLDLSYYYNGVSWIDFYEGRITTVEGKLVQSDRTKQTLTYGTSLINGVTSSPLDVQIEGKTLVNHGGREGGFHKQGKWDANLTIDTSTYKLGTSSGKIDNSTGTTTKLSQNSQNQYFSGKYVLFGVWAKAVSGTPKIRPYLLGYDSAGTRTSTDIFISEKIIDATWKFYFAKFDLTAKTDAYWQSRLDVVTFGTADDVVNFDGLVVYDIPKETYDKIGVSLTDQQVADMFPYVDSVQHNQNPIVTVEGANLLPPFYEWTLHANAKAVEPYKLELVATAASQMSTVVINVVSGQTYTISAIHNGSLVIHKGNSTANTTVVNTTNQSATFTVDDSFNGQIVVRLNNATSGTFTFTNPQLELGSTAKPFVPKNPSHLYANVKLGELSGKKDILFKENGDWKVRKETEKDVVLDGSLTWVYAADYAGYKRIYSDSLPTSANHKPVATKYDGKILKKDSTFSSADILEFNNSISSRLQITVADTDTGWGDGYTAVTADEVKAYFNGWKADAVDTGGKPTSWVSLVDGTQPSTDTLAYVSANKAPNYTPYLLSYVLATPKTEVVTHLVEGDLSISGLAQASVDGGVINREKATPIKHTDGRYYFNHTSVSGSLLENRLNKFVGVYKNGVIDTNFQLFNGGNNGNQHARTTKTDGSDFDTTAEYTVSYLALDKYSLTVNPLSVPIWYNGNLASTVSSLTDKSSDMATQISVNVAAIVDIYARLKAGGL